MIHKWRHAVGEGGCSPTRLGISRWMQTLLCARQAFREMQRNEMALEVGQLEGAAMKGLLGLQAAVIAACRVGTAVSLNAVQPTSIAASCAMMDCYFT